MKLTLRREPSNEECTFGVLYVNGRFFSHTLEDPVREAKIPNITAIPAGTYSVIISPSFRFKRYLPRLLNVPGYEGILIHPGNTAADTAGCILVGTTRRKNTLLASRAIFGDLYSRIEYATKHDDPVTITIHDPED